MNSTGFTPKVNVSSLSHSFYFGIWLLGLWLMGSILLIPQQAKAIDLYAMGSYWEVEDADGVWGGGLGVSIPLFTDYLLFDSRVYIFENSDIDDDDELELLPFDFGFQVHFLPEETLDPYILGGVSWVYADADRIDVDSDFGGYVGGGLDFSLSENLKLFGEVAYRFTELDTDRFRSEDIEVSGINANTGLKLHF